ncbi:TrbG/VirB9 family P-type conjugative transfer protein [Erythrobacter sp. Alg231-14]|uniref:TrbG/VirB9 family P-type conjugative transfer protein n=1 Tax=Erythrobacter sp. Alg231-14 TaxID=1922225 RepID=UPI000D54E259
MIRANRFRFAAFGCILAVGSPSAIFAQEAPIATETVEDTRANDPRLLTEVFDESRVFTINGKTRVQTAIKFAPDESIENVAVGDSAVWQIQPNQAATILFVKPLETNARTNMTVVTSRRTYLFDLVASPRNDPIYVLQFRYPELEAAEAAAALAAAQDAIEMEANAIEIAAANDPYAVSDPAALNFQWAGDGDRDLLPSRAYDNGQAVFLTWPTDTAIPAILVTNAAGDEGPVNFTVRGETVVLDSVPAQIILRSGRDTATLTNNGPSPLDNRAQSARADNAEQLGS